MDQPQVIICIADCLKGYHHPDGQPCVCVPDVPPPQPVPAIGFYGLCALAVVLLAVGCIAIARLRWGKPR